MAAERPPTPPAGSRGRLTRDRLLAGLRRFAILLGWVIAATAALSLVIGLLGGDGVRRSVSVGMYIAGSVMVVGALFVSSRPPVKASGRSRGLLNVPEGEARFETPDERRESFSVAWLLLALGLIVLALGVIVDGRHRLV